MEPSNAPIPSSAGSSQTVNSPAVEDVGESPLLNPRPLRSIPFNGGRRELVVCDNWTSERLESGRECVRKTRILYDSLRIFAEFDAEKTLGRRIARSLRSDLRAASLMREFGLWLHPGMRIVGFIPGIPVGEVFFSRIEMYVVGLHAPPRSGAIDYLAPGESGSGFPVATSVIVTVGSEDDEDFGEVLNYAGEGPRDRLNRVSGHQRPVAGNLGMIKAMYYGLEVRVIRAFKQDGVPVYVYDGVYKVCASRCEVGRAGFWVFKFRLVRMGGQDEMGTRRFVLANVVKARPLVVRPDGYLTFDLSLGKEGVRVFVFNDVDSDCEPLKFEYLARPVFPPFLFRGLSGSIFGCECVGVCGSSPNCLCARKNGGVIPYDFQGHLLMGKPLIFECGVNCKCPPDCRNRVSQGRMKHRLEVFRSRERDWRVRTLEVIRAGSFICEYSGVVVTQDQARVLGMAGNGPTYPGRFAPSWALWGDLSPVMTGVAPPPTDYAMSTLDYAIDVTSMRNVAAYIRHDSCPNVMAQFVLYDHNNMMFPHVMLFASAAIAPMKELTMDYGVPPDDRSH